ncbi:PEP/pyruvate-binding domain-containing protein [Microlunatus parietis]|uniref:Pyruvate,water dikinase n=1 Tax=Microlunatus parietis TaxID=682979 RepID=A0A7Y9I914_9ACTN|nr:PEP/pyruvate-binding domain-containing protein [Microlunatus parietis]NYE72558.1 pyruvate,water dikinase [Microlunatus parietis]
MIFVRELADPGAGLADVGGKGASLAAMIGAGFDVPDGFQVVTDAYRAFVDDHELRGPIDAALARVEPGDPASTAAASAEIIGLFRSYPVPAAVATSIEKAYADLGAPPVAVRSSATAEDLESASFAGQQDSFLNIRGPEPLLAAVRDCWASLWTDRAIAYRVRQGIDHDQVALAVVVQRLVEADASGVLFTVDPVTGAADQIVINAAWGLGEAVVSGAVTPDVYRVRRGDRTVIEATVAYKTIMTVLTEGGTEERPVPADLRTAPALTTEQAVSLAELGIRLADWSGSERDVEWCRTGDRLQILQSRPVTAVAAEPVPASGPDPWNDARFSDHLWANTNVGEAIPDVLTPASWSAVQLFMAGTMPTASIPGYLGYGRIAGRIYLDLSMQASLLGAVGVGEARFRSMIGTVFGRIPEDLPIPKAAIGRWRAIRSLLPIVIWMRILVRRNAPKIDQYVAEHPALCERRRAEIAGIEDPSMLAALWTDTLRPELDRASEMLTAATRSTGMGPITTPEKLAALVGEAEAAKITSGLGASAGQLASLGLVAGLDQLARGELDVETFNRRYAHRGPHEFELSSPRPAEDPHWIEQRLAEQGDGPDFATMITRQQEQQREAWDRLAAAHPKQATRLRPLLARWAKMSRDREQTRSEVVRYFWVIRDFVRRAGELLGIGDDAYFLDLDELIAALRCAPVDATLIMERRDAYEHYRALPAPPSLILGPFDPYRWAAQPNRRTDLWAPGRADDHETGAKITGFAGAGGSVEGVARVIIDPAEGDRLQPGEILVTSITNVGWTPLFPRASAVVTDIGAPLSHAAIVARELGIPAVVGTGTATMRISSGDRIRVDGSAGTVELLT